MTSDRELQKLFLEHGIPRRHLYPWWYRLYRAMGMRLRPPVLYTLKQHFAVEGTPIAVILVVGSVLSWWLLETRLLMVAPMACLIVIIPLLNWRMYRRLRARLGIRLEG